MHESPVSAAADGTATATNENGRVADKITPDASGILGTPSSDIRIRKRLHEIRQERVKREAQENRWKWFKNIRHQFIALILSIVEVLKLLWESIWKAPTTVPRIPSVSYRGNKGGGGGGGGGGSDRPGSNIRGLYGPGSGGVNIPSCGGGSCCG